MPIGIIAMIAINVGIAIISRLIAPRIPRARPQPFQSPTVEVGAPLPRGMGIYQTSGVIVLVRQKRSDQFESHNAEYTAYYVKIQMVCGYGPVHTLYDIIFDEKALSLQKPNKKQSIDGDEPNVVTPTLPAKFDSDTLPRTLTVAARQMFGGIEQEGGVQGQVKIYPGTPNQIHNQLVDWALEEFASRYPHHVHAVFGTSPELETDSGVEDQWYWGANVPSMRPVSFIFGWYPSRLLGSVSTDGISKIGQDANPAEMLFEYFVNEVWGKKEEYTKFDIPNWLEKASYLKQEGMGLSTTIADISGDDFKSDIEAHIDGAVVEDPKTGLIQLKLARPDYIIPNLPEITEQNSHDFKQGEVQYSDTVNEVKVKYKRFMSAWAQPIEDEQLTDDLTFSAGAFAKFQLEGRNITDLHIFVEGTDPVTPVTEIVADTDYVYDALTGVVWIYNTAATTTHQIVTANYTPAPTFSGFVDDIATAQNPANRQITGRTKSETYDYPMYSQSDLAQRKADLLLRSVSRKLKVFEWKMAREGAQYTRMDVVRINGYGYTNFPVRITNVIVGPLEDPDVTIQAGEDIYGEEVRAAIRPNLGGAPVDPIPEVIPDMAAIFCIDEDTLGVQASDITYTIEVEEADDEAETGAVFTEYPGTTTEVPITAGTVHRARLRRGVDVGEWTDWVDPCSDGDGPNECVLPTGSQSADPIGGILSVDVVDPQHRLIKFEFREQIGAAAFNEWHEATAPYSQDVELDPVLGGRIEWRLTYYDCDGNEATTTGGYTFHMTDTETPPVPSVSLPIELAFHTSGHPHLGLRNIPAEDRVVSVVRATETKFPLQSAILARIQAVPLYSTVPAGCLLIFQFEPETAPGTWESMVEDGELSLPIDETSLLALDEFAQNEGVLPANVTSEDWVTVRPEALADVRMRAITRLGDGTTHAIFDRIALQFKVQTEVDDGGGETEEPPVVTPGSCDVPTPLDMDTGWTEDDEGGSGTTWVLTDSTGMITISSGSGHDWFEKTLAGLNPNDKYTFYLTVDTNGHAGVDAFLSVVGGTTETSDDNGSTTLAASGNTDGSGEITIQWGIGNIAGAGGAGAATFDLDDYSVLSDITGDGWSLNSTANPGYTTVSIDGTVADSGGSSVKMHHAHSAWTSGNRYYERLLSGYTPGAAVSASIRWRWVGKPWFANPVFTIGVGSQGLHYTMASGVWGDLSVSGGEVDVDGTIPVKWGIKSGAAVNENFDYWFDGVLTITVAGAGTFEIDFSDLGYCEGDGVGTGTGNGGDGTDPEPPENPPYEPPPVGGTRTFGAWNIQPQGLGWWNMSVQAMTPKTILSVLRTAQSAGAHVIMGFAQGQYLDSAGNLILSRWKGVVDQLKNDSVISDQIDECIADGTLVSHQILDEPNRKDRYNGGVPISTVEQMAIYSKTAWPDLRTHLRIEPTNGWVTRMIGGLDSWWAEYHLKKGDPTTYINTNKAKAMSMTTGAGQPSGLAIGIHWYKFDGNHTASPGYIISPAQIRDYGKRICDADDGYSWCLGGWKYVDGMFSIPGWLDAQHWLRDYYNAMD